MTLTDRAVTTTETVIAASMAGLVVSVEVKVGQRVEVGDLLCVTETMKCEMPVTAPTAGWVLAAALTGATVDRADELVRISSAPPAGERRVWGPADVVGLLCCRSDLLPEAATGTFVEHDLVDGRLEPVDRPLGSHEPGVMVGVISHVLRGHPDRLDRVLICGDPGRSMGAVAEAECRLVIAAIELATERGVPVEWVAISAGARIAWDSGTENMDWCAAVARYIVAFTQGGGAINVIVAGINVGAQSYWNALATMLWHTSGALVMLAPAAMVLTGRRALALSGGGHHDSESDMGGYAEVMGPNGEAHHVAADLPEAYRLMFDHLALSEPRVDGTPARAVSVDTPSRSVCDEMADDADSLTLGHLLRVEHNPSRKIARALNRASGRRAAIVLANLAGFDGSAESMFDRQLEYGAEIARAVVNFEGPVVVVVVGRFHGGAYVVFSRHLNPSVTVLALEGTFVSVIGGDAAAGVVFAREVRDAVDAELADSRLTGAALVSRRAELEVHHRATIARRFDAIHSVDRAADVGSVDRIVAPEALRPALVDLLDRWGETQLRSMPRSPSPRGRR